MWKSLPSKKTLNGSNKNNSLPASWLEVFWSFLRIGISEKRFRWRRSNMSSTFAESREILSIWMGRGERWICQMPVQNYTKEILHWENSTIKQCQTMKRYTFTILKKASNENVLIFLIRMCFFIYKEFTKSLKCSGYMACQRKETQSCRSCYKHAIDAQWTPSRPMMK